MRWQFNCATEGVQRPAEDHFGGGPTGIPFYELAFGDGLFADCWIVVVVVGLEDPVIEVECMVLEPMELGWCALCQQYFIIDEDITIGQWPAVMALRGRGELWQYRESRWWRESWCWSGNVVPTIWWGLRAHGGLQRMPWWVPEGGGMQIDEVNQGFGGTAEVGWPLHPTHGQCER